MEKTKRAEYTLLVQNPNQEPRRKVSGLYFEEAWILTQLWVAQGEGVTYVFRNGEELALAGVYGWQYKNPEKGTGFRRYDPTGKAAPTIEKLPQMKSLIDQLEEGDEKGKAA